MKKLILATLFTLITSTCLAQYTATGIPAEQIDKCWEMFQHYFVHGDTQVEAIMRVLIGGTDKERRALWDEYTASQAAKKTEQLTRYQADVARTLGEINNLDTEF